MNTELWGCNVYPQRMYSISAWVSQAFAFFSLNKSTLSLSLLHYTFDLPKILYKYVCMKKGLRCKVCMGF